MQEGVKVESTTFSLCKDALNVERECVKDSEFTDTVVERRGG